MSRFVLHLIIYLWTLFKLAIKSHKIEHTFKNALLTKVNQAELYTNLPSQKKAGTFSPPLDCP